MDVFLNLPTLKTMTTETNSEKRSTRVRVDSRNKGDRGPTHWLLQLVCGCNLKKVR